MIDYKAIDLDRVKDKVCEYCAIDDAKTYIKEEKVIFNPLLIRNNLNETKEAFDLLRKDFNLSFDGIVNTNVIFTKASKDSILDGIELSKVLAFSNHCERIKTKLNSLSDDLSIKGYAEAIYVDDNLNRRISKVVDSNGNIKEDASLKLKEIFNKIYKNINDLHSASANFIARHSSSLQEASVYTRNDRVAFLLKNSDKNKFNGYQYGTSSSGLATYVEPSEFIELNNKTASLEIEKEEEIKRILREVTYYVSLVSDSYILNFESLVKLDVIFAKAEYGFYNAGVVSTLNNDNNLYLKDVAHPLIEKRKVVTNTYTLHNPYKGIVISGTNTGGKTVGLKLIGLSVLMSYLGIPLLASEASVPFYENVYIDIDDNQSIANALSTFSAHISNINEILNKANNHSLILIDELISGTDPKEAQAISLAILKKILNIGSYFVITTHYDDIKKFAYDDQTILLSSVGFDLDNLKPTYKYIENSVGVSNAIDIASRYLDDESVVKDARNYLEKSKSEQEILLEKLANEIHENEILKGNLEEEKKINDLLNKELNDKLLAFEKEKAQLKEKYKQELNAYVEDIKNRAKEKLEEISINKNPTIIKQIEDLKQDEEKEEIVFNVGDSVRVKNSSGVGEITSIDGNRVSVNVNGMNIKTKLDNLEKLKKIKKKSYTPKQRLSRVSRDLNLVGQRVEDGLAMLDNYLDNAYGAGLKEVKIIHGFGTGQLRKGVREHLKKSRIVKSFDNGDIYDGGSNVTIVKFK